MDQDMESAGSELPSEIICFQILPRLPSKSLMRFKCVHKSWSSLVRNPSFVDAHQNFHRNKLTHLLLTTWDKATRQQHFLSVQINQEGSPTAATHLLSLPTLSYDQRLYNAESINGVVFLYLSNAVFPYYNHANRDNHLRLFNPSTREFIVLPHALPTCRIAHSTHHFGFSPLTHEYKVLQVQRFQPRDSATRGMSFMFKIFKLGTSFWRRIALDLNDLPFDPFKCPFHRRSVCVNGAIHWMHDTQNVLVVFDIGDEKFRVIPLPQDYTCAIFKFNFTLGNIVEVFGCLALIGDKQLAQQNMMGLWILKDYENQVWVKETFGFPFAWSELGYPVPFGTIHTGELLLQSSRLNGQHPKRVRLHLYNMKRKSFRRSEIVLPSEWPFRYDTRLKLLASYDDSIVPLP